MKTKPGLIYFSAAVFSLILLFQYHSANAATITAASCSFEHIRTAMNAAGRGDKVAVPPGACRWNDTLTVNKAVTFEGAGPASTVLTSEFQAYGRTTDAPFFKYTPSSADYGTLFRVTGFGFDCAEYTPVVLAWGPKEANKIRIDHNRIVRTKRTTGNYGHTFGFYSGATGLIDSNYIEGNIGIIMTRWSASWKNESWDGWDVGSADSLFIEDNIMAENNYSQVAVASQGGSVVLRYNDLDYTAHSGTYFYPFDTHGHQGGPYYGAFGGEMYGNRIIANSNQSFNITEHRGGRGRYFYNMAETAGTGPRGSATLRAAYGDLYYVTTPDLTACPAGTLWEGTLTCAADGRTQAPEQVYLWNNRYGPAGSNGAPMNYTNAIGGTVYPPPEETGARWLRENKEFWLPFANWTTSRPDEQTVRYAFSSEKIFDGTAGVGCGPLAQRPATCTVGAAYWATSQSCSSVPPGSFGKNPSAPISGTLYRCASTNNWQVYYRPYAYPHPLRQESGPPAVSGDLNADNIVDVIDLGIFLSNWGKTTKPASDLNQDGRVDVVDLGILLGNWG